MIVDVEQLLRNVTARRRDCEEVLLEPSVSHDEEAFVASHGTPTVLDSVANGFASFRIEVNGGEHHGTVGAMANDA